MSKRSKRLATLLMATVLTLGSAISVSAANTTDTGFIFRTNVTDSASSAREKFNSSYTYVKVNIDRPAAVVSIEKSSGGIFGSYDVITGATALVAPSGQASSIKTGLSSGYIRLLGRSMVGSTSEGVWSPDSTKAYKLLN